MKLTVQSIVFGVVFLSALAVGDEPTFANHYTCEGKVSVKDLLTGESKVVKLEARYDELSFSGNPLFHVTLGKEKFDWTKKGEVTVEQTRIGSLVTGSDNRKVAIDGNAVRYTLVAPMVAFSHTTTLQAKFKTQLVVTSVASHFQRGPQFHGPTLRSSFHEVECEAMKVVTVSPQK